MKSCQLNVLLLMAALALIIAPDAQARRGRRHTTKNHVAKHRRSRPHRFVGRHVSGIASWSERTPRMVTAARGLPRGSKLWVWRHGTSSRRGAAVWVNDSGPYVNGRVLDLSTGAFRRVFGGLGRGHGPVHYKVLAVG